MIIARSPFSVSRAVRTFKETYQKLEMECGSERHNPVSEITEKTEIIEKFRMAAKAAGVAVVVEFFLSILI